MSHTMPMLTDSEREELIASCKFEIESLNEEIEGFDAPDASDYLVVLKSELLRQQIALAALNAEPAGNFTYHEDEDGDPTDFIVQSDGFAKNSFKLYTAPPVPAIKHIELRPRIENIELRSPLEVEDMYRNWFLRILKSDDCEG